MIKDMKEIQNQLSKPIKYRVVFDVDDVLCCSPIQFYKNDQLYNDRVKKNAYEYPGAIVINWKYKGNEYLHFFYPGLDRLILSILSWDHWSVDFFSSGVKERNEEVLPDLLRQFIAKHSDDVEADYAAIVNSGRCRIFSRDDMVEGRASRELKRDGFEIFGNYKKDLTVISDDVENSILVDDDRSYVAAYQYPFICVVCTEFKQILHEGKWKDNHTFFDIHKIPEYMMGILLSCKEELDSGRSSSLRGALDVVLQHHGKTLEKEAYEMSPWFLWPQREARYDWRTKVPDNPEFFNRMTAWIEKGENYWASSSLLT